MAKKSKSLHLEQDIWDEIAAYKKLYNLSSLNAAVERMLLERRFLINNQSNFVNTSSESKNEEVVKIIEDIKKERESDKGLDMIYDSMPD